MNIFQTIKNETKDFRDKIAVIEGKYKLSYGELITSVERVASLLKANGIKPLYRIGFLCNDSIDYIAISLAILSLSAVIVPLSPDYTESEIKTILDEIDVHFLLFEKGLCNYKKAQQLSSEGFYKKEFFIYKRETRENLPPEYYKINPAFIRFSSGTTGTSKGVLLSHKSIIERTTAVNKVLSITPEDTVLLVFPMSFHFIVSILFFLRNSATIVICSHRFPESLVEGIKQHKITFIYASPFHYHFLAQSILFPPESLSNVRLAISTTMKLSDDIANKFHNKFGFEIAEAYGIIEVGLPCINLSADKKKRGSVGRVLPDYEVKIINEDTDGVGEIYIKGKGMFDAYFSPWQNQKDIFRNGWFETGDLGSLDKDGFLTIIGRKKNIINFAGMKIFPYEVESIINQYPLIRESMVYGAAHPQYGQIPVAKVVLKEGVDKAWHPDDLRRFCYQKLTQYKVPKDFKRVNRLPKTASGKIKR